MKENAGAGAQEKVNVTLFTSRFCKATDSLKLTLEEIFVLKENLFKENGNYVLTVGINKFTKEPFVTIESYED